MSIMNRKLWTQKLSDDQLKRFLDKIDKLQITEKTEDEELISIANTWYNNVVAVERFRMLSYDVWKEAAFRWRNKLYIYKIRFS